LFALVACQGVGGSPQNQNQATIAVNPSRLTFPTVQLGSNSSLNASLSATGAAVTVSSAQSDSSEFTVAGISLPATIPAGQSLPFTVTFTPTVAGNATATMTFISNASNSPLDQPLSGMGQAPTHWVGLIWDAAPEAVSYNIYRKRKSDPLYSQIDSANLPTSYTDNDVSAGQTYDYVVTAVNTLNQESAYSSPAQVAVPSP
jgi:hypothetical protein